MTGSEIKRQVMRHQDGCGCTACMVERVTSLGTRAIRIDPDVKRMLDAERKPSDPNYSVVIRRLLRKSA